MVVHEVLPVALDDPQAGRLRLVPGTRGETGDSFSPLEAPLSVRCHALGRISGRVIISLSVLEVRMLSLKHTAATRSSRGYVVEVLGVSGPGSRVTPLASL